MIGLLVVFTVFFLLFAAAQIWQGEKGTIPPRILTQRSIAAGAFVTFSSAGSMMLVILYITIWFQAVKGTTAFESGIRTIPLVLSLVVGSALSGFCTMKIGYYVPAMILMPIVASTGAGLLSTLKPGSGHAEWIGYQVVYGFGLGLAMQTSGLAAQAVLKKEDVSIGTSIMFFSQQLGGAIFVSVGQNVFINTLVKKLSGIPGLDTEVILSTGATDLRKMVPEEYLATVLSFYNQALTRPFAIAIGLSAVSILGSVCMEWKNIKKIKQAKKDAETSATDQEGV